MGSSVDIGTIKELIIKTLGLDLIPDDLGDDQVLFGEDGMGLDSIDAFEIATAVQRTFQLDVRPEDTAALKTPSAIATYVSQALTKA